MTTDLADDSGAQRKLLESASGDTAGMLYTLYINALLFVVLILFFEANRYMKQIYLKRLKMKFEVSFGLLSPPPPTPVVLMGVYVCECRYLSECLPPHRGISSDGCPVSSACPTPNSFTWSGWTGTCS